MGRTAQWKVDYVAVKQRERHQQALAILTADLPINSVTSFDVADDPYSYTGQKMPVVRSLRNDPLAGLKARRQIEEHEYQAGRMWQACIEAAQIGVVSAIDPGKEAVDGGRMREPLTDKQWEAANSILAADKQLGVERRVLIREVLAAGFTIKQCAARRGRSTKRYELYLGQQLKSGLDTLALFFGLRTAIPQDRKGECCA